MPYFDEFKHVYGWNISIVIPLENLDAQNILQQPILGTHFLNPG